MSAPAEEPHVTIKSIDEAVAENVANRGPANRYRAMGVAGLCGEMDAETGDIVEMEEEETTWCVVSEAHTALDVMTGDAAVFAICETLADAEIVAEALNKHFAN
ncbi:MULTISPECIES: hypothetical protein [Aurantimonas]|uniref:hypothetical protein n=1 Tax=Aurantimonas TaxID=182269 RepID=UPI0035113BE8